jgi:hypothetical protein
MQADEPVFNLKGLAEIQAVLAGCCMMLKGSESVQPTHSEPAVSEFGRWCCTEPEVLHAGRRFSSRNPSTRLPEP